MCEATLFVRAIGARGGRGGAVRRARRAHRRHHAGTGQRRRRWTARAATLLPPAALQLAFNDIARTDLESHVNYLQSVADYHERIKAFFFPIVFDDTKSIDAVAWRHAPAHRYRGVTSPAGLYGMHGSALGGAAFALLTIGMMRLRAMVSGRGSEGSRAGRLIAHGSVTMAS